MIVRLVVDHLVGLEFVPSAAAPAVDNRWEALALAELGCIVLLHGSLHDQIERNDTISCLIGLVLSELRLGLSVALVAASVGCVELAGRWQGYWHQI